MKAVYERRSQEYTSGELVEPGLYVDIDTGAVVQVREVDELPDGSKVVRYSRRFRRVESAPNAGN